MKLQTENLVTNSRNALHLSSQFDFQKDREALFSSDETLNYSSPNMFNSEFSLYSLMVSAGISG